MDAQPEQGSEEITKSPRPCPDLFLPHQFMALCARWLSVGIKKSRLPAVELPWLMLARHPCCDDEFEEHRCTFFTPSDGRVQRLSIPELHRRLWRGSSHGWLITVLENSAGSDGKVSLFNPLTRGEIELPAQKRCPLPIVLDKTDLDRFRALRSNPSFFKKAILSCDPGEEGCCRVVAITSFRNLSFCNVGDDRWSVFDGLYEAYEDIVFFKGQLYAVNATGRLSTFDLQVSPPSWRTLDAPRLLFEDVPGEICSKYLVGCGEQLLLVLRLLRKEGMFSDTVGFEVFRWEEGSGPAWEKVKDLGGRMLFLGTNCSEAFPADMFPSKAGFKGDCIYYTGDGGVGVGCMDLRAPCVAHDMGVYSMEDGVIGAFFSPDGEDEEELVYPPIWVSANPWPDSLQQRASDL